MDGYRCQVVWLDVFLWKKDSTVFVSNDCPIRVSGTANDVGEFKSEVVVLSYSSSLSRIND